MTEFHILFPIQFLHCCPVIHVRSLALSCILFMVPLLAIWVAFAATMGIMRFLICPLVNLRLHMLANILLSIGILAVRNTSQTLQRDHSKHENQRATD